MKNLNLLPIAATAFMMTAASLPAFAQADNSASAKSKSTSGSQTGTSNIDGASSSERSGTYSSGGGSNSGGPEGSVAASDNDSHPARSKSSASKKIRKSDSGNSH